MPSAFNQITVMPALCKTAGVRTKGTGYVGLLRPSKEGKSRKIKVEGKEEK